ncbi:hypothetical protein PITCH_A1690018 [uncultured Desulfobacterium sp.]|uniref:Uncharacterized protein n=1 Tax=uncultured Desulfobacterium sp. TaxID=201089 RepID=A0A445MUT9_9BACT|nr:hypothetical protein PITCH_A1690018 [uncultured Desulfobacterium sp.]
MGAPTQMCDAALFFFHIKSRTDINVKNDPIAPAKKLIGLYIKLIVWEPDGRTTARNK